MAALIADIGPPCWTAYDTSAALYPFDGFRLLPPFHVLVPRGRNIQRVGHFIHVSDTIPPLDCEVTEGLPCMSPTRTLLQIASTVSLERLTAALDGALRDCLTTEDFLHRRIYDLRASGRNGIVPMVRALEGAEITRGGQSWLEREFLRVIEPLGLPRPQTQAIMGQRRAALIRVDFRFEGTPLVIETLGYRWHRTKLQMGIDAERFNRLVLEGFTPIQFTYEHVVGDPDFVRATVSEAASRCGLGPRSFR